MDRRCSMMGSEQLLKMTPRGIFCSRGGFYIDPVSPAAFAVITHAHADHALKGSKQYLCEASGAALLRRRVGENASIQTIAYGEEIEHQGVRISLHPAGHILGSSQVRVEVNGQVWVVSGDYKTAPDRTCVPFEPIRCHCFVTESTFAHPFYSWRPDAEIYDEIRAWWSKNRASGKASVLYAYSLGKAQRVIAALHDDANPVFVNSAVGGFNVCYREAGVSLRADRYVEVEDDREEWRNALVILPPTARWAQSFSPKASYVTAFASGWSADSHWRRYGRGFALSDHADYASLLETIRATQAERIVVMHGYVQRFVSDLLSKGYDAVGWTNGKVKDPPSPQLMLPLDDEPESPSANAE